MGDSPDTEQNMDFCSPGSPPSHEEDATALDTTTQFAVLDNVVGDPKDFQDLPLRNQEEQRERKC